MLRSKRLIIAALLALAATGALQVRAVDDDAQTDTHAKKKVAATPHPHKKAASADEDDAPAAKAPGTKKAAAKTDDPDAPAPKPKPKATPAEKPKGDDDSAPAKAPAKETAAESAPAAGEAEKKFAPAATIPSADLAHFNEQPEPIRALIEDALVLASQNLTYKFGSDDPANGGMDCSGTMAYLLRRHGLKDVPRDAAGQYVWARKHAEFFAVISKKPGGFEFADLKPGDLMFWSGTYQVDRDPPITHSMLYLGVHRARKVPVMFGASDGRSYDGQARYGVSVFDFKMPRTEPSPSGAKPAVFLGYARIPGLREPAKPGPEEKKEEEDKKPSSDEPKEKPKRHSHGPAVKE